MMFFFINQDVGPHPLRGGAFKEVAKTEFGRGKEGRGVERRKSILCPGCEMEGGEAVELTKDHHIEDSGGVDGAWGNI